jgi:hypothetical protein
MGHEVKNSLRTFAPPLPSLREIFKDLKEKSKL